MFTFFNRVLSWGYRKCLVCLIRLYFFYLDLRGTFIRLTKGETISDKIVRDANGNVFCVFLLYQKYDIPKNVLNVLEKLSNKGVNIIVVSNLKITAEREAQLEPFIHRLIVRRNIGRDFGGYRLGVLTLLDESSYDPERLLILNDSIFYRDEGLDFFISEMLSRHEYVGVAENYEFQYHVGSYALAMGPKVIKDKRFKTYWKQYKLTEVRPKVIKRGEMELNHLIINQIAIKPYVIYSPRKLQAAINKQDMKKLIDSYNAMPMHFDKGQYKDVYKRLANIAQKWNMTLDGDTLDLANNNTISVKAFQKLGRAKQTGELIGISKDAVIAAVNQATKTEMEIELINFTVRSSQIHFAGVLLLNYLNCPIIKNDMVVRFIYTPGDLQRFSKFMSQEEYEEFFYIQTHRGVPAVHWKGFKRAMLDIGYL